jgi:hypothetical protein
VVRQKEVCMTTQETPDRQNTVIWSVLVVLGALLTIVGWWRFIN